jgi:hypothetical protein
VIASASRPRRPSSRSTGRSAGRAGAIGVAARRLPASSALDLPTSVARGVGADAPLDRRSHGFWDLRDASREQDRAAAGDCETRDREAVGRVHTDESRQPETGERGAERGAQRVDRVQRAGARAELRRAANRRRRDHREGGAEAERGGQRRDERDCEAHQREGARQVAHAVVDRRQYVFTERETERHGARGERRGEFESAVELQMRTRA